MWSFLISKSYYSEMNAADIVQSNLQKEDFRMLQFKNWRIWFFISRTGHLNEKKKSYLLWEPFFGAIDDCISFEVREEAEEEEAEEEQDPPCYLLIPL